ncbi:MAG TPA: 3-dehydroquinate synthase [Candidatus Krumholzibacteria bacterium]|nr:3-dehydroquinate synthase [Candidatus Krumholzibacteria bacterium]
MTESTHVIILCGFMGTGKTATGHALASLLSVPFFDTDRLIEEASGKSVSAIFASDGEERFRELESEVVRSLQSGASLKKGAVIATGGGILQRDATHLALASLGKMIVLDADLESIAERAESLRDRPLLPRTAAGEIDRAALKALFAKRAGAYARVAWHVDTTGRTPPDVAFEIAERLQHAEGMIHLRVGTRPLLSSPLRRGEAGLSRVVVQRGALASLGTWVKEVGIAGPVFVFASRTVAGFHGVSTRKSLDEAGIKARFIEIDDSETGKNMDQAERLLYELADAGATRDIAVIALGGGVTGDLSGFVAATYMRGVAFVQVPTTLVAQADASIGGKVGVNHPRAKNIIGTIHQPHLVLSDPDTLATLPARELASGMAEVVKTAIIGSPTLFERLRAAASNGAPQSDPTLIETAVRECVRIKGHIVEADPFERDERRMLNLGHTLGHAVETAAGYGTVTHGEAVAIGLMAALTVSVNRGVATKDFLDATRLILTACGLPVRMPSLDAAALVAAMGSDKKRRATGLTFVLPVAPGDVRIVNDVREDELIQAAPQ